MMIDGAVDKLGGESHNPVIRVLHEKVSWDRLIAARSVSAFPTDNARIVELLW